MTVIHHILERTWQQLNYELDSLRAIPSLKRSSYRSNRPMTKYQMLLFASHCLLLLFYLPSFNKYLILNNVNYVFTQTITAIIRGLQIPGPRSPGWFLIFSALLFQNFLSLNINRLKLPFQLTDFKGGSYIFEEFVDPGYNISCALILHIFVTRCCLNLETSSKHSRLAYWSSKVASVQCKFHSLSSSYIVFNNKVLSKSIASNYR